MSEAETQAMGLTQRDLETWGDGLNNAFGTATRGSLDLAGFENLQWQFQDITGSWSYDTPAAFPITLTHASLRQIAERYLARDSGRTIKIDPWR